MPNEKEANDDGSGSPLCYLPMIRELLEYNEGDELADAEACPSRLEEMAAIVERHLRLVNPPQ